MSHTPDLLTGVAELLAAEGVGVYDDDSVLPAGATALVLGPVPDEPASVVGLTPYPVSDDDSTDAVTAIQAAMRAGTDPTTVLALADAVFDALHNRRNYLVRGVHVEVSWRNSQGWIGKDAKGRMELSANYYFRTVRSGSHLID
ncbi:minor capsid protein [Streptomyces sp. NPDC059015]|uniref:minor capsid protein n=1 Tax=unclassified Streptomyces TaxID=2593676 RepID=UPI0036911505